MLDSKAMWSKYTFCNDENVPWLHCQMEQLLITHEHLKCASVNKGLDFRCYLMSITSYLFIHNYITFCKITCGQQLLYKLQIKICTQIRSTHT
jgi:hypothetical protein